MNRFAATVTITTALALTGCDATRPTDPGATPEAAETPLHLNASSSTERVTTGGADITFIVEFVEERWSFEAKRTEELGDLAATGEFQVTGRVLGELVTAHGDIVCFTIVENRARLAGTITHSNTAGMAGKTVVWSVEDNGEGKNSPPDGATSFAFGIVQGEPLAHCMLPFGEPDYLVVEKGNVQVHH